MTRKTATLEESPPRGVGKLVAGEPESIRKEEIARSATILTPYEFVVTLGLIGIGMLPLAFIWHYLAVHPFDPEQYALLLLIGLFSFGIIEAMVIFLLYGLQRFTVSEKLMKWLLGVTIGEIAILMGIAVRHIFK